MAYETPPNLVELMDGVVGAAGSTAFYRSVLSGRPRITSVDDFLELPVTALIAFREQRLADVVTDPRRVQWIVGRHGGQAEHAVAVAEGMIETGARYELLKDALRETVGEPLPRWGAVITSSERRYFAAEVSSILGYLGLPAHVFIDDGAGLALQRLHQVQPDLLVILTDGVEESELPSSLQLCITFRGSHKLARFRQLDLYLVDEFGFLGHSTDLVRWILYNDQYYFETSADNNLVVTALHNLTQPLLRLETEDEVVALRVHEVEFGRLTPSA